MTPRVRAALLPRALLCGALSLAALSVLTSSLTACGATSTPAPPASDAPAAIPVVASTDVYGAVVRAVGGDRVAVTSLIDSPAADPHSFEAPPAAAAAVARARLVIVNGGGYDDFATRLAAGSPATVIDVVQLSGLTAPPGGELNEHVWYSLPTMKALAARVAADLGAVEPASAARFTTAADAFDARVDGIAARVDALKATHAGQRIAVTEPVPLYLTAAAGLVNATPPEFSEAVEQDTDPPAAALAATLDLFGADPVRALLVNGQTRTPVTDQVDRAARAAHVPVVAVSETLPAGVDDYVDWMRSEVDALAAALGPR
jgi:zinc/manganese transport system substrate-binding protein